MRKKVILLLVSLLAVGSLSACSGANNVIPASSYVDYSFEEYTDPSTEPPTEATEAPTEKPTQKKETATEIVVNNKQKKSEAATEKTTEKKEEATQKATQQVKTEQPTSNSSQTNNSSEVKAGSFSETDVSVIYNNHIITLDNEFDSVKATFGEPEQTEEYTESKLTDNGKGYVYKYDNMKVYTYMKENIEYVESISVEDEGLANTTKSITVGNSTTEVKENYGTPNVDNNVVLKYKSNNKMLVFYASNGTVTGFEITR